MPTLPLRGRKVIADAGFNEVAALDRVIAAQAPVTDLAFALPTGFEARRSIVAGRRVLILSAPDAVVDPTRRGWVGINEIGFDARANLDSVLTQIYAQLT